MATASQLAKLRERVGAILRSKGINRINFTYDGVTIDSADYFKIARAVIGNLVHVKVVRMEPGVGAQYDPDTNTIEVPRAGYGTGLVEETTVVHEATHAILDMHRVKITALNNEITANIAGGIYLLYNDNETVPRTATRRISIEIAKDVLYNGNKILGTGSLGIGMLATAIINNPVYRFIYVKERIEYKQNGIPGM